MPAENVEPFPSHFEIPIPPLQLRHHYLRQVSCMHEKGESTPSSPSSIFVVTSASLFSIFVDRCTQVVHFLTNGNSTNSVAFKLRWLLLESAVDAFTHINVHYVLSKLDHKCGVYYQ